MVHYITRLLAFMVISPLAIAAAPCNTSCGDIEVPYPFGLHEDEPHCYFNESYAVYCNRNSTHTDPYMRGNAARVYTIFSNISIYSISVEDHELRVPTFYLMYNFLSNSSIQNSASVSRQMRSHFPVSSTKNVFTVIGCDTYAVFSKATGTDYGDDYARGCLTTCTGLESVANGSCSGIGCCQTNVPKNVYNYDMTLSNYSSRSQELGLNNCSYAFVTANDSFSFSIDHLSDCDEYFSRFNNSINLLAASRIPVPTSRLPMVLDWSVGDGTCEEAKMNETSYMCKGNYSTCSNADNGTGYRCSCWKGCKGNPYLSGDGGCQDIDECKIRTSPCVENARCANTIGNFTCSCPNGLYGDGRKYGTGCSKKTAPPKKKLSIKDIALGVSISVSLLLLLCSWLYWGLRQRKIVKQREKFFQQNGGLMLQRLLAEHKGPMETTTIFTDEELKKATNNFHESTILGQGGHGTVYKGELNSKIVAIKKSKFVDQRQVKEFINEILVLTQINHKNVVKLIGCCLEREVPLLVYEFITNGTLFDHIHNVSHHVHLSWRTRLRIVAEIAGALSYLHSDTTTQVIHRDIKTANILLDDNFTAKVSDFGASRLVPVDEAQVTTLVQGTLGYLDPEYFNEMELTDKSDVYNFGVVLAELLTGMKALSFARPECQRNLFTYFVSKFKEGNLLEIIDKRIFDEEYVEEINEVAKLATQCLRMRGEERPSMKEVSMELEGIVQETRRHLREESNRDETESLLIKEVTEQGETTTYYSMS